MSLEDAPAGGVQSVNSAQRNEPLRPNTAPKPLWIPSLGAHTESLLGRFMEFAGERAGRNFEEYFALWEWSVDELDEFWATVWEFFEVRASVPYDRVMSGGRMPGVRWFEGTRLNYAARALAKTGAGSAIIGRSETVDPIDWSWDELHEEVARVRAGLERLGVCHGDRVAAYLPNVPQTVAAFLATASLGAIWTSCAPEFGAHAVLHRFAQVEPTVLFGIEGYQHGGRRISRVDELAQIRAGLPSLRATVVLIGIAWIASSRPSSKWSTITSIMLPAWPGPRTRVRSGDSSPMSATTRA